MRFIIFLIKPLPALLHYFRSLFYGTLGFLKHIAGDQNEACVTSASNGLLLLIKVLIGAICNRQVCLNVCCNRHETKAASIDD